MAAKQFRHKESFNNHGHISRHLRPMGGGIYSIMPWSSIEEINNKQYSIYKLGLAVNFQKRAGSYHTSFPNGFYWCALLYVKPKFKIPKESCVLKWKEYLTHYGTVLRAVENAVFRQFFINNVIQTRSQAIDTSPVIIKNNQRVRNEGNSEWIFSSNEEIHKVFTQVANMYNNIPEFTKMWAFSVSKTTHIDTDPHTRGLEGKRVFKTEIYFDLSNTTNLKENMIHHETEFDYL